MVGGCWGCECARCACKVSVQGKRARWEELHMGVGGCCAALIGCSLAQTQGGMVMVGGLGGECARQVCKTSVQGGKSFIWGWGAAVWLLLAAALLPMGGGTNSIGKGDLEGGWGCECAR